MYLYISILGSFSLQNELLANRNANHKQNITLHKYEVYFETPQCLQSHLGAKIEKAIFELLLQRYKKHSLYFENNHLAYTTTSSFSHLHIRIQS